MKETSLIVIGALNTDIVASSLDNFPRPNDPVYGGNLVIGPGGKSGNIASMAARLAPTGEVAMISKTVEDAYGLWREPITGLQKAGVNTDFITVLKSSQTVHSPSVALIAVDKKGNNMCFILPGISQEFNEADIDAAVSLFEAVAKNDGIFALSLECPLPTAQHAIRRAVASGIRVALDPGGVVDGMDITGLIGEQPYLIKPNEHEARIITGITITNFQTASQAAVQLKHRGAHNVLITHGEQGAYLFTKSDETHIPVPKVTGGLIRDATGCGDQTMATLCAYLQIGKSLEEAAQIAVLSGTLQFYKSGIQPITKAEIEAQL